MADCEKCIHEQEISSLKEDAKRNSEQHKEFYAGLKTNEIKGAVTDNNISNIMALLGRLEATMNMLAAKPSKRLDVIFAALVSAAITGVVAFVMAYK